jgi:YjbR
MPDADTGIRLAAEDVRAIALPLPETAEKPAWGRPTFRVRGKIFAGLSEDDTSVGVKCPKEERAELIAADREVLHTPRPRRQLRLATGPARRPRRPGGAPRHPRRLLAQAAPRRLAAAYDQGEIPQR